MNVTVTVNSSQATMPGAYRTDMTITNGNGITNYLFVKSRVIDPDGNTDDTFLCVASPEQVEDLPEKAPILPDNQFRDYTISLISSDPNKLSEVVQQVLSDIDLTITQYNELSTFTSTTVYTVDSTNGITS